MSKSVRRIVGVVAAIAVPFAAPAIASAIGLSAGISGALGASAAVGSTLGGALTGAVLGGAASKLQGGKFGQGALFGGIGGGIGGYMTAPTSPAVAGLSPDAALAQSLSPVGAAPAGVPGAAAAAPGAAGLLTPDAALAASMQAPTTAAATPGLLSRVGSATAQNFRTMTGIGAPAAGGAAGAGGGFLSPAVIQGATTLAAGALSGPSAAEKEMLRQQTESLRTATAANQAAYQERLNEARKLIGESAYFDPEYTGLQSARRAQIAGARAKRENLRGLTGGERQAEARRADLETARTTGTAYDVGYGSGVGSRLATRQAGVGMFPTSYPDSTSAYSSLMGSYGGAERAAAERASDIGKFAGDLYGAYTGMSLGNPTKTKG